MAVPKLDRALENIEHTLSRLKEDLEDDSKDISEKHLKSVIEALTKEKATLSRELEKGAVEPISSSADQRLKKLLKTLLTKEIYEQRTANLGNVAASLWKVVETCESDLNRLKEKVEIKRGSNVDFEKFK